MFSWKISAELKLSGTLVEKIRIRKAVVHMSQGFQG